MTGSLARSRAACLAVFLLAGAASPAAAQEARVRMALGLGGSLTRGVAFSPDGKRLAFGSDKRIFIWDLGPVQKATALLGHELDISSVAFAPDGKTLATGSYDKTAALWDAVTGRELARVRGFNRDVLGVAFAGDGKTLFMADADGVVKCLDVASREETRSFRGTLDFVFSLAFSRDGTLLGAPGGFRDGTSFNAWDLRAGRRVKGPTLGRGITAVAFSDDNKLLATSDNKSVIEVWDLAKMKPRHRFVGHAGDFTLALAFRPDGKVLATGGQDDKTLRLWDLEAGKEIRAFREINEPIHRLCYSPDGKRLAVVAGSKSLLLDAATLETVELFRGHTRAVRALGLTPDGKLLASTDDIGSVRFWDLATGREKRAFDLPKYTTLSHLVPLDGKTVLSYGGNGLHAWDAATGKGRKLSEPLSGLGVEAVARSPDGSRVAVCGNLLAVVWDAATGAERARFPHPVEVSAVGFGPDGKTLLTDSGGDVRTWDLATGKKLAEVEAGPRTERGPGGGTYFSPDGRLLARPVAPGKVAVWSTTTGKQVALSPRAGAYFMGRFCCFSPDGRLLAWIDLDRVRVHDVSRDRELLTFRGHHSRVLAVTFVGERTLASGGEDTGILIWEIR